MAQTSDHVVKCQDPASGAITHTDPMPYAQAWAYWSKMRREDKARHYWIDKAPLKAPVTSCDSLLETRHD